VLVGPEDGLQRPLGWPSAAAGDRGLLQKSTVSGEKNPHRFIDARRQRFAADRMRHISHRELRALLERVFDRAGHHPTEIEVTVGNMNRDHAVGLKVPEVGGKRFKREQVDGDRVAREGVEYE
jgi:hypothetical protein